MANGTNGTNRFHIIKKRGGFVELDQIYLWISGEDPQIVFNPYGLYDSMGNIQNSWAIYLNHTDRPYFYIMGLEYNRESFISQLAEEHPDDMTWILFHPEVLDGRWGGPLG